MDIGASSEFCVFCYQDGFTQPLFNDSDIQWHVFWLFNPKKRTALPISFVGTRECRVEKKRLTSRNV